MRISALPASAKPRVSVCKAGSRPTISRVVAAAKRASLGRDAAVSARLERSKPLIDHLMVVPPALLDGLSMDHRDASRQLTFCSQHEALQILHALKPTHIFPEARVNDLSIFDEDARKLVNDELSGYPEYSVNPAQMQHLMVRGVADIYAAISGVRIKSSISQARATRCAKALNRHVDAHQSDSSPVLGDKKFPLNLLYDLPAEDMARRIEHFLGQSDGTAKKIAVVTQYPFALSAHLNPYIQVREHDCVRPFVTRPHAEYLEEMRLQVLAQIVEQKFNRKAPRAK